MKRAPFAFFLALSFLGASATASERAHRRCAVTENHRDQVCAECETGPDLARCLDAGRMRLLNESPRCDGFRMVKTRAKPGRFSATLFCDSCFREMPKGKRSYVCTGCTSLGDEEACVSDGKRALAKKYPDCGTIRRSSTTEKEAPGFPLSKVRTVTTLNCGSL
jgi:hypothetical protein